jgi:DNA-binding IclR family transcriptional regulator
MQSLVRALEVLEALNGSGTKSSYSIAYLAQKLSLPPSTIFRLLQTLCAKKYAIKDEKSHEYMLGPALIPLGITARNNLHLQNFAYPILEKLVGQTAADAFLVIPSGNRGLVLEHIDSRNSLRVLENFGFELDLHCGAIRKTLLAYQSKEFIEAYIDTVIGDPQAFPKTDARTLLDTLAEIRKDGIAVSHSDYINGAAGIGAPVFDDGGRLIASIGIITPESKAAAGNRLEELTQAVKNAASELSALMGYRRE